MQERQGRTSRGAPAPVRGGERGTSLVEALIALALLVTSMTAAGQLFMWSRREGWSAAARTAAVTLARQKLELLRSLELGVDYAGLPHSDHESDVSREPARDGGGGLRPSPAGTLTRDTEGFVDYVRTDGSRSPEPDPRGGEVAFVRRWSIEPVGSDAADTVLLTVVVMPVLDIRTGSATRTARLCTVHTRVMK